MTVRELPRRDWVTALAGTEIAPALDVLPIDTRMLVVEDDRTGAVIGAWAVIRYVHVEGLWIAPAHRRRGRVLAKLLAGMRQVAESWGHRAVLTAARSDDVRALITKFGGRALPGEHFALPITGPVCR